MHKLITNCSIILSSGELPRVASLRRDGTPSGDRDVVQPRWAQWQGRTRR